jgi:putative two-component system response regulator
MYEPNLKRILIVDDASDNIAILTSILGDYKKSIALNGEKALKIAFSENQPDLILLDIMMPGMNGYEVCKVLKNTQETKDISVIFQTSLNAPIDEQKAFELGASDYITKPFDPAVVKSRIRSRVNVLEEKKRLRMQIENLQDAGSLPKDEQEIERLLSLGETNKSEFKSTLRQNLYTKKNEARIENQCLKTVAGFLNNKGGCLLVGVDDDGTPLGLSEDGFKNNDKFLLHWFNLLKEAIGVDLTEYIESEIITYKEKKILFVGCKPAPKPVFFSRDGEEYFYVRVGNSTQKLNPSEMLAYIDDHYGAAR